MAEKRIIVIDKSSLVAAPAGAGRWMSGSPLGISHSLWVEVVSGTPRHRNASLTKLGQLVGQARLFLPLDTLVSRELQGGRAAPSVVDEEMTAFVRANGLPKITEAVVEDSRTRQREGTTQFETLTVSLLAEFARRAAMGSLTVHELRGEGDLAARYGAVLGSRFPKTMFTLLAEAAGVSIEFGGLDTHSITRAYVHALCLIVWDEFLAQRSEYTGKVFKRLQGDRLDAEHVAFAAVTGALATEDARMRTRATVIRSDVELHSVCGRGDPA